MLDADAMVRFGRMAVLGLVVAAAGLTRTAYIEWQEGKTDRLIVGKLRARTALKNRKVFHLIVELARGIKYRILTWARKT